MNRSSPRLGGDSAGDRYLLARLLAESGPAQGERQHETHPHFTKETLTLQHVFHKGVLILRVYAWP